MYEPKNVIQCNYRVASAVAAKDARAYVVVSNPGNGHDRIKILVRSRSGRWVEKWESVTRLKNFRIKKLHPEKPMYERNLLSADERYGRELLNLLGAQE